MSRGRPSARPRPQTDGRERPVNLAVLMREAFVALNDLVIAPLWIALGWLSTKVLPRPARPAAVVGVAVAGVLTLISLPYVLGPGARSDNASFLPHDIGRNVLLIDLAVLLAAAVWGTVATVRARRVSAPGRG